MVRKIKKEIRRKFIEQLTKKAGNELMNYFRKDKQLITLRGTVKEVVTRYDKMIDQLIIEEIKNNYPEDNILTEEGGFLKGDSNFLWIVDSLDGTGNFANQNPLFSVCIALMKNKEVIFGAIYIPAINEFYLAEKGKGAFLNQIPIRVSKIGNFCQSYLFYCEGGEKDRLRTGKILNTIYPKVTDIRKLGSAGVETAWLAAGRAEVYFTTKIDPWDVAAGVLLVEEAGGQVTDFKGNPWKPEKTDLLFSNKKIHNEILNLIKNF